MVGVDRTNQDVVAWTFSDAVLDPAGMGDLRVNGQGPVELIEWSSNRLIVRYDAIADPATWQAISDDNEPYFGDDRQLAPATGALDRYL